MNKFKINKKIMVIAALIALITITLIYINQYKGSKRFISFIDIGIAGGMPSLKPQLEIEKIENLDKNIFNESNKNDFKIKAKYIKDINTIQIVIISKNQEKARKLIDELTNDIINRSQINYNNNIQNQRLIYSNFRDLIKSGNLIINGDGSNRLFDNNYNKSPILELKYEENYNNEILMMGLFILLCISYYLLILFIYDKRINK